tara:strand:+ start:70 stop:219 length:150 start_codon:yes stop_codon:yes gene_type:complete
MVATLIMLILGIVLIFMSFLIGLQGSFLIALGGSFFGLLAVSLPFILEF